MGTYHSRKYSVNELFFDVWSVAMAYVLGFWFADGYMRKDKSYRVVFISNDKCALLQIREAMASAHPIRKRIGDNTWGVSICSKHLYESLGGRGGNRRKSRNMVFPKIPEKYLSDFIRGYFDGDGSVFRVRYMSTKNHKPRVELRSNFTSGSMAFLKKLMLILNNRLGLTLKKIGVYNGGLSLKLGYATGDTEKLMKFMYYPKYKIGLQRKACYLRYIRT